MMKHHEVGSVAFNDDSMVVVIDGATYKFNLSDISGKLSCAGAVERERYEVSPSGYGIHWPLIDEDLSIDGLLGIHHKPAFGREKAA